MPGLLRKLDAVCELRAKVQEACDCSFLYWHKVRYSVYKQGLINGEHALYDMA